MAKVANLKVSLIIPAYNEEERLGAFLKTIVTYWQRHRKELREVLLVDDGSSDATVQVAKKWQKSLPIMKVIRHQKNRGKGAAVATGVLAAKGELIVFTDADGATPIGELNKMIGVLGSSDVAVGNRWMKGARTERRSSLRRFSGWVYRTYMRLFGLGGVDTMCGFKGYKRAVARDLFRGLLEERWLFDAEVAYKALRAGYTVVNFPIRWESKDGSKLSTVTLIMSAFKIMPLMSKIRREIKATRKK